MRVLVGILVLLAGVGLAFLNFRAPQSPASSAQILLAQRGYDLVATSSIEGGAAGGSAATGKAKVSRHAGPARTTQPATPWERSTVVAASADASGAASRTLSAPDTSTETLSGPELTRALQKELRRVGCYYGEIDGDWGPASKRAMSGFNDRVNASLPVETPDHILLRIVQGYTGEACGSCRPGEARNRHDNCVPAAVLAHSNAAGERGETTETAEFQQQRPEPLPGLMAVGAPVPTPETSANNSNRNSTPRRAIRRSHVADQGPPKRGQKRWAQTFFDQLSRP